MSSLLSDIALSNYFSHINCYLSFCYVNFRCSNNLERWKGCGAIPLPLSRSVPSEFLDLAKYFTCCINLKLKILCGESTASS